MTTTQIHCPDCKAALTVDPHRPAWCPTCNWGLDPSPEKNPSQGPLARRWQHRLNRLSAKEHDALLAKGLTLSPSSDRLVVLVLATVVHLVTVAVVVLAVVVFQAHIWVGLRYGVSLLLLAIVTQVAPRFPRFRPGGAILTPENAPALYALVGRLAGRLGVQPPEQILVNSRANASWGVDGHRRIRILVLGLPLWAVLDGQSKVALLGHELGHEANGDLRSGWWVSSALRSLWTWRYLLSPVRSNRNRAALQQYRNGAMGLNIVGEMVTSIVISPVLVFLGMVRVVLSDLSNRSGQRAEHVADRLGAELGGTAGAIALAQAGIAPDLLEFALDVAVRRDPHADLWQTARDFAASVPDAERERRFRLARKTLQSVDATHPPTLYRIELLEAGPSLPATELLSSTEEQAVDLEVRKGERWVRARLLDRQKG